MSDKPIIGGNNWNAHTEDIIAAAQTIIDDIELITTERNLIVIFAKLAQLSAKLHRIITRAHQLERIGNNAKADRTAPPSPYQGEGQGGEGQSNLKLP